MRLRLGAVVILLTLSPCAAAADQGDQRALNLSWDDCGAAGSANRSFACDTNTGTPFTMVASFFGPDSVSLHVSTVVFINLAFGTSSVPAWWQLRNQGSMNQINQCRDGEASADGDFSAYTACALPWGGRVPSGGLASYTIDPLHDGHLNVVRLVTVDAVASADAAPIVGGSEYYAMKVVVTRAQTVGQGACGGCDVSGCFVLDQIEVVQPNGTPGGSPTINDPPPGGRNSITWQGGTGVDCFLVPTKNRTWGQIKSLYR